MLNQDRIDYKNYLKSEFSFFVDKFEYEFFYEFSLRGEILLQFINRKTKRKINIYFNEVGISNIFEIKIEKNYRNKIRFGDLVLLDTKYLKIKEYSKEISGGEFDMKNITYNYRTYTDLYSQVITKETPIFKSILIKYLEDIILGKSWTDWEKVRKRNLNRTK